MTTSKYNIVFGKIYVYEKNIKVYFERNNLRGGAYCGGGGAYCGGGGGGGGGAVGNKLHKLNCKNKISMPMGTAKSIIFLLKNTRSTFAFLNIFILPVAIYFYEDQIIKFCFECNNLRGGGGAYCGGGGAYCGGAG